VPPSLDRSQRVRIAFGADSVGWDEEKVVERYDLCARRVLPARTGPPSPGAQILAVLARPTARILASAIAEVRRAIKSRPVIFDLMPELFTLLRVAETVERCWVHTDKQNFRRLVEGEGLVEPTGDYRQRTGGRPAQLYRFRRNVLLESHAGRARESGRG